MDLLNTAMPPGRYRISDPAKHGEPLLCCLQRKVTGEKGLMPTGLLMKLGCCV
jgi:hypothetical protein